MNTTLIYSHIATMKTNSENKDKIIAELDKKFPKSKTKLLKEYDDGKSLLVFQNDSSKSSNILQSEILQIDGILSVNVTYERKHFSKISKAYSSFLMVGMIVIFITFSVLVFLGNTAVASLTGPQILVIELGITLSITYWLYRYDKKWEHNVADVLLDIDIIANEIREYVKDLNSKKGP